jgi:hypothetical protein
VITALQDAANRLGVAERSLLAKLSSPQNGHPSPLSSRELAESNGVTQKLPISRHAAITLALAETSVPLAPSPADEAERWLRIMRKYGHVGNALEELGMASGELATPSAERRQPDPNRMDPVKSVAEHAAHFAHQRDAPAISTVDVLFAVIRHYGSLFDRALYGTTNKHRSDLLAALYQAETVVSH